MRNRFEGKSGARLLIDTIKEQRLIAGDSVIADEVAAKGELLEFSKDDTIIEQGAPDNDIYLILVGSCKIIVNGRVVATRSAGTHFGEMAAVEPSQPRSAGVVADTAVVLFKLSEVVFSELTDKYPLLWRRIAKELARRLEQRNALITTTHDKIRVFILSSVEALPIARAIQNAFEHDPYSVVVWTNGVFRASQYPLESLENQLDQSDFAIAIAQPDDMTIIRGKTENTPRDNVLFELGLFMGRLGRHRTLLMEPRDEDAKLPSDLKGITTILYKTETDHSLLPSALGPACNHIRNHIQNLGPNN
jgi:predicted nucleotide-binding protein